MPRQRRQVQVSQLTAGLTDGRPRLWAFSYADLAVLFGVHEGTIKRWVKSEKLDPANLRSVCDLLWERLRPRVCPCCSLCGTCHGKGCAACNQTGVYPPKYMPKEAG